MMTLEELGTELKKAGYPVAYDHFDKNDPQTPPFICYLETSARSTFADGITYCAVPNVRVELYCSSRNLEAEAAVESILTGCELAWTRETDYLDEERIQMTIYDFTLR